MANIKADEITKLLREQISNYEQAVAVDEVGQVISVGQTDTAPYKAIQIQSYVNFGSLDSVIALVTKKLIPVAP